MRETAWVNYYGYLNTMKEDLQRDVSQFRAILQRVEIGPPA